MNRKKRTADRQRSRVDEVAEDLPPPNRTIDESPAGAQELTRKAELRHHLNAPGQLPIEERKDSPPDADEAYGQTMIPLSVRPGSSPTPKRVPKARNHR